MKLKKNVWRWKNLGKPDKILKIVEEILDLNKRIRNQPGEGLKIFKMDF